MPWDVYERSQGYHDLVFALALRESELNSGTSAPKRRKTGAGKGRPAGKQGR